MLICLCLMEVLKMQILIRKFFWTILLCLGLCACSGNEIKDNAQTYPKVSNEPSSKIFSVEDVIQTEIETKNGQAYSLNNKATFA